MRNLLITITVVALTIVSCTNESVTISGTITSPETGKYVYLKEVRANELIDVDSVRLAANGEFKFSFKTDIPQFLLLNTTEESFLTLLVEAGDKLRIEATYDSLYAPVSVRGSAGTDLLRKYDIAMDEAREKFAELNEIYMENMGNPDFEKILEALEERSEEIVDELREFSKRFIDENSGSMATLLVLYQQALPGFYVLHPLENFDYFSKVDSILYALYPTSDLVISLHEEVTDIRARLDAEKARNISFEKGSGVPEIALPSPNGEVIALSSKRGQVVLLDFWAAWCKYCREESPYLVKAYEKFNSKGFTIYQVSFDSKREDWVRGIEEDNLGAWTHVSDLRYWSSELITTYGIETIPFNILLDREGKVIATNLRKEEILNTLEEVMNQ